MLVENVGRLSDAESLAGEEIRDPLLAAHKAELQGNSPPDDSTNARLLNDLTKTAELNPSGLLV